MLRSLRLYGLWLSTCYQRLRHDLGRELVVGISAAVLFATFVYVFNDFLNVQVAALSGAMRARFAQAAAVVVLGGGVAAAVKGVRGDGVSPMARAMGEEPRTLSLFRVARVLTIVVAAHGAAWILLRRYLLQPDPPTIAAIECGLLGATVAGRFLPRVRATAAVGGAPTWGASVSATLAAWRRRQILGRNRVTRATLAVGLLFLPFVGLASAAKLPPFVAAAAALVAGYFGGAALCFQLAEELPTAWTERGFGVSHDEFVAAYDRLGLTIGLGIGTLAALLGLVCGAGVDTAGKAFALGALPAVLVPLLMLQIDGRRAAVTLLLTLIASLFVGTAVLASWFGLLLIPLLRYYALRSQAGRFYRA